MKAITSLLATAVLISGVAVASAQTKSQKMDEQAGGNNQAVERNPSGAPVGSKTNPSPTVGRSGTSSGPRSTTKQGEQAGGNGQAVERNPAGSTGGSKANPSR